jgi:CheY-like chemotaxis protein
MPAPSLLQTDADTDPVTSMESARCKTVLCVDDEKIGLRVRKIMLESRGYKVLIAHNGPEGLKVFTENQVDLVVLDYYMPDQNGGEVAA